ncbi:iron donor protein CyaY [Elsinoe australis]|uniref:ferroxidase n=1 Tax=Elsinoe australis TaxID=40998 RepID=A0A2P8AIM0_9PEZI|nr:iron donor protein CyaY [Elsinoe australis]
MSQRLISRRAIGILRTAQSTSNALRLPLRAASTSNTIRQNPNHGPSQPRLFSSSSTSRSIMPEHEDPPAPKPEPTYHVSDPTPLSEEAYATLSEQLMEQILTKVEEVQEEREDVDVEYSAGVLNVTFPPAGTYVINKQPPNKQIWLSSPISGPKRFDWVVAGEGMESKEGSGVGEWMYLRDGSTLSELLRKELGISVVPDASRGGEV